MTSFSGEFDYSLDAKGRVKLPPSFREALAAEKDSELVITRDYDTNLALYSASEYEKVLAKASMKDPEVEADRIWIQRRVGSSFRCQVDAQGRIKIPAAHVSGARLAKGGTIKFVGFMRYVQIWDPEEFERHISGSTKG